MNTSADRSRRLEAIAAARAAGGITEHSATAIREWLTAPRYADFSAAVAERIDAAAWKELDDVFWTVIPFGTGGRRGKMYPVGCNAINDRTIGESAQGLADYVRSVVPSGTTPTCTIAYDTRHRSEHFARLCTEVLLAATAARRSSRSPCGTRTPTAGSWSPPATTRPPTTP
jgi:phosphoglucomutase/phosphomannomutase